jgi:apolipoprotein D and lipocalin family protein
MMTMSHTRFHMHLLWLLLVAVPVASAAEPPPTVASVDLARYVGTWYEIASIPNRFQRECVADTTATYATRADGRLDVINRCRRADGATDEARGVARVVDPRSNARLEVSFVRLLGWHLFWGDYWVLDLAADYSTVIVGHPERRYGWILSRTPTLEPGRRAQLNDRLAELGYDSRAFANTPQTRTP